VRRSVRLFRLFLAEQSTPEHLYQSIAHDAVCANWISKRGLPGPPSRAQDPSPAPAIECLLDQRMV